MKSVVVEASTVAKAIETAWIKADKPEEFFIRVLQEHQLGFLGFGSQKAKVVFFFKNSQKSDSLFPVVLKQKEYTNLFDNNHLKIPAELNFVDTELNKHIILGAGSKKKPTYQNQQQKNKKNNSEKYSLVVQSKDFDKENKSSKVQSSQQKLMNKAVHGKQKNHTHTHIKTQNKLVVDHEDAIETSDKNKVIAKNLQIKKDHQNLSQQKNVKNLFVEKKSKNLDQQIPLELALKESVDQGEHPKLLDFFDKKDDVVKDIARALKKVQSQKIVAHVSRQTSEKIQELQVKSVDAIDKIVQTTKVVEHFEGQKITPSVSEKVVTKFKRRPLVIDNNAVSGIKPRQIKRVNVDEKLFDVTNIDDKKN